VLGAKQGDDVGRRDLPVWQDLSQPTCRKVMCNVLFGANDYSPTAKRPIADHSSIVARHDGVDPDHLLPGAMKTPERDILVILANGQTAMPGEVSR
jgi:hypothetical protein